jgi:ferrous iron transport protein B
MSMKPITIALVGQPNVGKSMLINAISGAHLKVANYSGATVDKAQVCIQHECFELTIMDLPGSYALSGYSPDEKVTSDFLKTESYDLILNVVDSTNLERNLYLTSELMRMNRRMVMALNMTDEADKEGIEVKEQYLSEILGFSCVKVSAKTKQGMDTLIEQIVKTVRDAYVPAKRIYSDTIEQQIATLESFFHTHNTEDFEELGLHDMRMLALQLLREDKQVYQMLHALPMWIDLKPLIQTCKEHLYTQYETHDTREIFMEERQAFARGAALDALNYKEINKVNWTQKVDSVLINKYLGIPIFLFLMWGLFQVTFELGSIPMDYIDTFFGSIGEAIHTHVTHEGLASLLADGVIAGVGAVILFLPNILILFLGIALLETTGYMSRVAFLLDGFFHKFGLHGKSFIPLVTGFGCSVPAYMAARVLKSKKDRLITMFIIGFMSCGAKLPVYVLFAGAFFSEEMAGNVLFVIYIGGAMLGLIAAKMLRVFAFQGEDEPFVMEMPKYRLPSLKLIWFTVWNKGVMYVKKAGTYILAASMLIWFLSAYPHNIEIVQQYESRIESEQTEEHKIALAQEMHKALLENSYLGAIGKTLEPLFVPMGFDWRMTVAIGSGLAAKEVIVATLGVLYALGDEVDEESNALKYQLQKHISFPSAVAFIVFVMIYLPCLAATVVFAKESGERKYVIWLVGFTLLGAWILAFGGYHLAYGLTL